MIELTSPDFILDSTADYGIRPYDESTAQSY